MGSKDLADLAAWIRERLEAMGLTELMIRAFTTIYGSFVISGFIGYGSHLGGMWSVNMLLIVSIELYNVQPTFWICILVDKNYTKKSF